MSIANIDKDDLTGYGRTNAGFGSVTPNPDDQRKVGLRIIQELPQKDWVWMLEALGIKEYERRVIRRNGIPYDAETGRRIPKEGETDGTND